MNKRASVLLALLMSCSSLIWRKSVKSIVELDDHILNSLENQNFYKVTDQLKVNVTEKLRSYLKAELGMIDEEPKRFYQLSFYELVNKVNPWGYRNPVDRCNDQISCLLKLLIKQKYEKIMDYTINYAAYYGFPLSENKVILLFFCGLWILKKLIGLFLAVTKVITETIFCGILNNIKSLYSIICVLLKSSSNRIQKVPTKIQNTITIFFSKVMTTCEEATPYQNEIIIEKGLNVLENRREVKVNKVSSILKKKVCKPSRIPKWDGIKVGSKDPEVAHYLYVYAATLGSKIPRLNALKEKLY